jgi:hypothetical protein
VPLIPGKAVFRKDINLLMLEIINETIKSLNAEQYRLILQVVTLMTTIIAIVVAKSQLERNTNTLRLNNLKTILDLKKELHKKLNELWKKMARANEGKELNSFAEIEIELTNVWVLAETISHFYKQGYLLKDDMERHFKDDIRELYNFFIKMEPFKTEIPRDYPQTAEICLEWDQDGKANPAGFFNLKSLQRK